MSHSSEFACRVHVLAVSPFENDRKSLEHIFGHTAWVLDSAKTLREAYAKLAEATEVGASPILLCEEVLPDGSWKDLLHRLPSPGHLIVTSNNADDRLWAEVLNLGAYDVLAKPFRSTEVFRTVGIAWRHSVSTRKPVSRSVSPEELLTIGATA